MEDILYVKELHHPILNENKPANKNDDDWKLANRKTIGMICQYIDQSVFQHMANDEDAFKLWRKLESMYERKATLNKALL